MADAESLGHQPDSISRCSRTGNVHGPAFTSGVGRWANVKVRHRLPGAPLRNRVKSCCYEDHFDSGRVAGCPPPSCSALVWCPSSQNSIKSRSMAGREKSESTSSERNSRKLATATFCAGDSRENFERCQSSRLERLISNFTSLRKQLAKSPARGVDCGGLPAAS